jgi:hypothetical protein
LQALIQYPDVITAQAAKLSLDGQNIYNACCTLRYLIFFKSSSPKSINDVFAFKGFVKFVIFTSTMYGKLLVNPEIFYFIKRLIKKIIT